MRMTINERDARLEVSLMFPDSRVVDLDSALRLASQKRWLFHQISKGIDELEYKLTQDSEFLAEVRITHGLEPPTRVLFENRLPEAGEYLASRKAAVLGIVKDFLEECANRGLVSSPQKDKAVTELNTHQQAIEVGTNA